MIEYGSQRVPWRGCIDIMNICLSIEFFGQFMLVDSHILMNFATIRFVRFVSTPEILERVYTIESEILQIEEAIVIQGNNDMGPNVVSIF